MSNFMGEYIPFTVTKVMEVTTLTGGVRVSRQTAEGEAECFTVMTLRDVVENVNDECVVNVVEEDFAVLPTYDDAYVELAKRVALAPVYA